MFKKLSFILIFIIISFLTACFVFAWDEPNLAPPQANVAPPINTSNNAQTKDGALTVTDSFFAQIFYDDDDSTYFLNPAGPSILSGMTSFGSGAAANFNLEIKGSAANGYFGVSNTGQGDIFKIDSSGNVGIGTPTSSKTLDVNGNIVTGGCGLPSYFDGNVIGAYNPNSSGTEGTGFYVNIPAQGAAFGGFAMGYGTTAKWLYGMSRGIADSTGFVFFEDANAAKVRMFIATGGYVGLQEAGYRSPDRRLDILDTSNPQLRLTYTDNSVYTDLQTTSAGHLYINPSGGNVGIGITGPGVNLHVQGGTGIKYTAVGANTADVFGVSRVEWAGPTQGARMNLMANGVSNVQLSSYSGDDIYFNHGGNVGIGDSSPDEKLEVNGAIKLGNAANTNDGTIQWTGGDFEGRKAGAWVSLTGTGGTPVGPGNLDYLAKWDNLGGDNLGNSIIFDNGTNVGIGANNPQYKLDVNGDLRLRGDEVITFNPGPNSYDVPVGDIYAPPPYINPLNGQSLSLLRLRSDDEVWVFVDDDQNSAGGFNIFDDRDNGANDPDALEDVLFSVGEVETPNFYGLISLPWWTRMAIGDLSSSGNTNAMLEIMPAPGVDYLALSTTNAPANTGNILMVKNSGNVGINRNNPSQKLQVGGNISVVGGSFIDDGTTLNVPDHVFNPDYQLMPLKQLDQFVKENKHLPGLPDMNDVEAWADLSIQDRDMKLLEKIEELTLYIIKLEKRVSELESQK